MPAEKLFFATSIESMFHRGLGKDLSRAGRERLKAAGLDLDARLRPSYPFQTVRAWMDIVRTDLYPGMPAARADELLGRQLVVGFQQTLIGKATLQVFRLLGPERMIRRLDENMRQLNNFTRAEMTLTGPGEATYWVNEPAISPGYLKGSLLQLLESLGYGDARAEERPPDARGGVLLAVRWAQDPRP